MDPLSPSCRQWVSHLDKVGYNWDIKDLGGGHHVFKYVYTSLSGDVFNAYWLGAQLYHELRMNSLVYAAGNSFGVDANKRC